VLEAGTLLRDDNMDKVSEGLKGWMERRHYQPVDEKLSPSAEQIDNNFARRDRSLKSIRVLVLATVALLMYTAILGATVYLITSNMSATSTAVPEPNVTHCGGSHTTALERKCKFDLMSFSWLPPACYDAELSAEFERARNWTWYEDSKGQRPVSKETAVQGDRVGLHVPWEYHTVHCTFMWKKMHRAVARGAIVDSLIGDYGHTKHCAQTFFQTGLPEGDFSVMILTKYPYCNTTKVSV
jgi:hypothetical protein